MDYRQAHLPGFNDGPDPLFDFLSIYPTRARLEELADVPDPVKPAAPAVPDFDPDKPETWVGQTIRYSWGYDMTMNEFAKIIEVSKTGKTIKAQRVATVSNGAEHYPGSQGKAQAGTDVEGPVFRLYVRRYRLGMYFVGKFPQVYHHWNEETCRHDKLDVHWQGGGSFSICDPEASYYENHCD